MAPAPAAPTPAVASAAPTQAPPPTAQVATPAATVNVTVNQQLEQLPETERREDWVPLMTNFPMQEHQFCKVMTRFTHEYREAERHRNEVKQNMVIRQMREDLAKLDHRDFVMVSGELLAVKEPEGGQPLIAYRYFPAGTHCSKVEAAKNQDFFVVQLDSIQNGR